jgi:hypothetical protein
MMRICAFSRPAEDLPAELHDVANWDIPERARKPGRGTFELPLLAAVTRGWVRVVVVTALMAGKVSRYRASLITGKI